MRNDRLTAALSDSGMTGAALAAAAGVAPRTVSRWLTDDNNIPRPDTAAAAAAALGTTPDSLWRPIVDEPTPMVDELVTLYPSRAAVPTAKIAGMVRAATDRIDIVAVSALTLWEGVDGLVDLIAEKAVAGVQIRILLADPDARWLSERGEQEGIGELIRARAQLAWAAVRPLRDRPGITLAMHCDAIPATLIRADEDLLVNLHVLGTPDSAAPVLHLRHQPDGRTVGAYLASIDLVANRSTSIAVTSPAARISRRTTALRPVADSAV